MRHWSAPTFRTHSDPAGARRLPATTAYLHSDCQQRRISHPFTWQKRTCWREECRSALVALPLLLLRPDDDAVRVVAQVSPGHPTPQPGLRRLAGIVQWRGWTAAHATVRGGRGGRCDAPARRHRRRVRQRQRLPTDLRPSILQLPPLPPETTIPPHTVLSIARKKLFPR